jgi:thiamine-phosphate pyrophosphorylase
VRKIGRLHVLTDAVLQGRWSHADIARAAARGGADVVQYRDKRAPTTAEQVGTAQALRQLLPSAVQLIVDDRVDVAVAAGADGVHVGRHDLSPLVARRLLPSPGILGGTANSLDEARRAFVLPLDYLGVGPVFGTRSKAEAPPPLGLPTLARIVAESPIPVIAIGGITPERVASVLECGAWGVAVLSAVVCTADPEGAVARFRGVLDSILSGKHVET